MKIKTVQNDDGIAYGVKVYVNDELVTMVDVIGDDEEVRTVLYHEIKDDPIDIVSYNR